MAFKRKADTALKPASEQAPQQPAPQEEQHVSKYEAVLRERQEWYETVNRLVAEADRLASERAEVEGPLPLLQSRLTDVSVKRNEIAAKREAIAQEVQRAEALTALGIETRCDEGERLAALEAELRPLDETIALLRGKIDTINAQARDLQQREDALRSQSQDYPEGLPAREREAYIEEANRHLERYVTALRVVAGLSNRFPSNLNQLRMQSEYSGTPLDSVLPPHARGTTPISEIEVTRGLEEALAYLRESRRW